MNTTTKLLLTATALIGSSSLWATALPDTGTTIISQTQCAAMQAGESGRIGLSKDVAGDYLCSATNVAISTGSYKGRGRYYAVHSAGSTVSETDNGAKFADATAVHTATAAKVTALLAIADSSTSN